MFKHAAVHPVVEKQAAAAVAHMDNPRQQGNGGGDQAAPGLAHERNVPGETALRGFGDGLKVVLKWRQGRVQVVLGEAAADIDQLRRDTGPRDDVRGGLQVADVYSGVGTL